MFARVCVSNCVLVFVRAYVCVRVRAYACVPMCVFLRAFSRLGVRELYACASVCMCACTCTRACANTRCLTFCFSSQTHDVDTWVASLIAASSHAKPTSADARGMQILGAVCLNKLPKRGKKGVSHLLMREIPKGVHGQLTRKTHIGRCTPHADPRRCMLYLFVNNRPSLLRGGKRGWSQKGVFLGRPRICEIPNPTTFIFIICTFQFHYFS